jgi:hypothetical protein
MGQVLHGCATTTEAIRRAIQGSQESLRALSRRYGVNPKTIAKWKKRESAADLRTGPRQPGSTVLSPDDEAIIVAFRRHTLLPLDDCLYALQPSIGHLTKSSLHRCLQRHGISRLPQVEGSKPARKAFKRYPIGYFHIDIAEVRTAQGKLYLFVAIDRTSKFAFVRLEEHATVETAVAFLQALFKAVPYKVHTVLTDNGIQFCDLPCRRNGAPLLHFISAPCRAGWVGQTCHRAWARCCWDLAREGAHSASMPAALITLPHFWVSAAWNFASSSDVVVHAATPPLSIKVLAGALLTAATSNSLSFATTGAGVPAGRYAANQ